MSGQIFLFLTMFLIISSGLIVAVGVSVPTIATQIQGPVNCDVQGIPQATCTYPQYIPPTPTNVTVALSETPWWKCIFSLACVAASVTGAVTGSTTTAQSVWNGFSQIAYGIEYFGNFAYVFFNKLIQAFFLILAITSIMSTDFNIPFLQYIFLSFIIFYIMYGISMLKPGGSGLP
jgi:hypothetical protein